MSKVASELKGKFFTSKIRTQREHLVILAIFQTLSVNMSRMTKLYKLLIHHKASNITRKNTYVL